MWRLQVWRLGPRPAHSVLSDAATSMVLATSVASLRRLILQQFLHGIHVSSKLSWRMGLEAGWYVNHQNPAALFVEYILENLVALGGCSQDYIQSVTNEPCRIITVLGFVHGTYKLLTCLEIKCRSFTLESQTSVSRLTLCKLSALVVLYLRSTITYTVKHRPNVRGGSWLSACS